MFAEYKHITREAQHNFGVADTSPQAKLLRAPVAGSREFIRAFLPTAGR